MVFLVLPLLASFALNCTGGDHAGSVTDGKPYLGEKAPGIEPVVFAAGIVSTEADELNAIFTPDGREFYFSRRRKDRKYQIMVVRLGGNGKWQAPEVAPFSGRYSDADPFITPDGKMMLFISKRPEEGYGPPHDIWIMNRVDSGWTEPVDPGYPLNTPGNEIFPSMSSGGMLYYVAEYYGGKGRRDVYRSHYEKGVFGPAELVAGGVSSEYNEGDPFISPDGSYLIFVSADRPGGYGSGDLYVSFREEDGSWSEARNLGPEINSEGYDYCPSVTPDGKYFFFTKKGDIYWVDFTVIERLR